MSETPIYQRHLLLVDDDVPTRLLLRSVLGEEGYAITEAGNGVEALQAVKERRPDLVLMDVMMPELDGFGACALLRQIEGCEDLPVIMLTGAEDIAAIDAAFNAGATDFITKPINWSLLIQRVRYSLRTDEMNRELRKKRVREATMRKVAGLGFWDWQPETGVFRWSAELNALTGLDPDQCERLEEWLPQVHEDDRGRLSSAFAAAKRLAQRVDVEVRLPQSGGGRVLRVIGERSAQTEDHGLFIGVFQDITEVRKTEALVDYLAFHDDLTGLGNRRLFIRTVGTALNGLRENARSQTLLVGWIDLVRFHRINDELGEKNGNVVLEQMAQRLRAFAQDEVEVARPGGDVFCVMLYADNINSAQERFERLLDTLSVPMRVDQHELVVNVSAGCAVYPDHAADADQLLALAQEAQRSARAQGRPWLMANVDPVATQSRMAALEMEHALRKALENQELFLLYQPQLCLRTRRIVGAEALLRWRNADWGVVSPAQFIPLLEETGMIHAVGEWVLRETCKQAAAWAAAGLHLRVGVNLSPRQFLNPRLFDSVMEAANEARVDPRYIELEITESLAMQDLDLSVNLLQRFREAGFNIAIDDFGIGYSSLEYLLRFPLDTIKIDRAFISNITATSADRAIARSVTVLGKTLGLKVIAEGVETQRQSDFIEALDVDEVQGYWIGKPMPADELEVLARVFPSSSA